jgi:hypothetical protein
MSLPRKKRMDASLQIIMQISTDPDQGDNEYRVMCDVPNDVCLHRISHHARITDLQTIFFLVSSIVAHREVRTDGTVG